MVDNITEFFNSKKYNYKWISIPFFSWINDEFISPNYLPAASYYFVCFFLSSIVLCIYSNITMKSQYKWMHLYNNSLMTGAKWLMLALSIYLIYFPDINLQAIPLNK